MRICVVGTSNSIYRDGYTLPLRASKHTTSYDDCSLGKSVGILFALTTDGLDFGSYDFCILDFAVNEQAFCEWGLELTRIRKYVRSLAARAIKGGCIPVIMLLPRRETRSSNSRVGGLYHSISKELHLPIFDAIRFIEDLERDQGRTRENLFRDGGHMTSEVAQIVGNQLLDGLAALPEKQFLEEAWNYVDFQPRYAIDVTDPTHNIIKRENSLYSQEFVRLEISTKKLFIPSALGSIAEGMFLNLGGSGGKLRISGRKSVICDVRNGYRESRDEFVLAAMALPESIQEAGGGFFVDVASDYDKDVSSGAVKATTLLPEALRLVDEGVVEFGGIIVESENQVTCYRKPASQFHKDLSVR